MTSEAHVLSYLPLYLRRLFRRYLEKTTSPQWYRLWSSDTEDPEGLFVFSDLLGACFDELFQGLIRFSP